MGTNEFIAGANLALKAAGVQDERLKQRLLQQAYQAKMIEAQREQGESDYKRSAMDEASQMIQGMTAPKPIDPDQPGLGNRTPQLEFSQLSRLLDPLMRAQSPLAGQIVTGMGALERGGTPEDKYRMAMDLAQFKQSGDLNKALAVIAAKAGSGGGGGGPAPGGSSYHPPITTTEGILTWNPATQKHELATGPSGKPLMAPSASPELAGEKKAAVLASEKVFKYPKAKKAFQDLNRQWNKTESIIDKAMQQVGPFTAGWGSYISVIPATTAKDLQRNLESISANIAFDKLQSMRENSPTGGALGQVSDLENKLLAAVQGSLMQDQSVPQLKENLANIKNMLQELRVEKQAAFDADFRDVQQKGQSTIPQESEAPFQTKTVIERRRSKSGKILVKYSDGTIGEE